MSEKIIFTTTDPEGRVIHLHEKSWDHIRIDHPEVTKIQGLKAIIQKPDFITEVSARTSLVYSKISSISLYFNVYAKMDDTYKEGRVSSAFITRKSPRGDVIWYQKT